MKKLFAGTISALMALSIMGCQVIVPPPDIEEPPVMNPAKEADTADIDLRIGHIKLDAENKTISYQLHNDGDNLIEYGLSYVIEKKEDKEWVKTGLTDNMAVIMIMMMIEPERPTEDGFSLSEFEFDKGQYRIVRQYRDDDRVYDGVISFNVDEDNEISLYESFVSVNEELSVEDDRSDLITLPVEPPAED